MVKAKDGFFAVSLDQFRKISEQHGMPECCLYLIYCCGSDRTNTHTMWSKHALTKRTSISVRRAQRAEQNLIDGGYVTKLRGGKHPKFRIERSELDDAAWLPMAFIEGWGKLSESDYNREIDITQKFLKEANVAHFDEFQKALE